MWSILRQAARQVNVGVMTGNIAAQQETLYHYNYYNYNTDQSPETLTYLTLSAKIFRSFPFNVEYLTLSKMFSFQLETMQLPQSVIDNISVQNLSIQGRTLLFSAVF